MPFPGGIFHKQNFASFKSPLFSQGSLYFNFPIKENNILPLRRSMEIVIVTRFYLSENNFFSRYFIRKETNITIIVQRYFYLLKMAIAHFIAVYPGDFKHPVLFKRIPFC